MNKKAAIQLTVQFIVLTVLALITVGIGFYIVTNIFITAEEYKGKLDEQTQENIIAALKKSGEAISLPITSYTIRRGDNEVIAVGVLNSIGKTATFTFTAECTEGLSSDDTILCAKNSGMSCNSAEAGYCSDWVIIDTEKEELENRDSTAVGLFVRVPDVAPSGIFGYTIKVYADGSQYGTSKKMYITVPE